MDNLVVNKMPHGLKIYNYYNYGKYFIISPFINTNTEIEQYNCFNSHLLDYLNNKSNFQELVNWVSHNSVNKNNTEELVKDAYIELIKEYFSVNKPNNEFDNKVSPKENLDLGNNIEIKNHEEGEKIFL